MAHSPRGAPYQIFEMNSSDSESVAEETFTDE